MNESDRSDFYINHVQSFLWWRDRFEGNKFPFQCQGCSNVFPLLQRVSQVKRRCPGCGWAISTEAIDRQLEKWEPEKQRILNQKIPGLGCAPSLYKIFSTPLPAGCGMLIIIFLCCGGFKLIFMKNDDVKPLTQTGGNTTITTRKEHSTIPTSKTDSKTIFESSDVLPAPNSPTGFRAIAGKDTFTLEGITIEVSKVDIGPLIFRRNGKLVESENDHLIVTLKLTTLPSKKSYTHIPWGTDVSRNYISNKDNLGISYKLFSIGPSSVIDGVSGNRIVQGGKEPVYDIIAFQTRAAVSDHLDFELFAPYFGEQSFRFRINRAMWYGK